MGYVWCVCFILEAPLGPPMGGGVGFMGLISLMGPISLMGLIGLISLMGEPFSPPPFGRGCGWACNMTHIGR